LPSWVGPVRELESKPKYRFPTVNKPVALDLHWSCPAKNHAAFASAQCTDDPFTEAVSLGTSGWCFKYRQFHVFNGSVELGRKYAIAVMDEKTVAMVRGDGFSQLLQCPRGCGVGCPRGPLGMGNLAMFASCEGTAQAGSSPE
jgi:hypothetical protein